MSSLYDLLANAYSSTGQIKDSLTINPSINSVVQKRLADLKNLIQAAQAQASQAEPAFNLQFSDLRSKAQSVADNVANNPLAINEIRSGLEDIRQKIKAIQDQLNIQMGNVRE